MEKLKRFQGSTYDTFSRRKLIEDRDTILHLTAKILELQPTMRGGDVSKRSLKEFTIAFRKIYDIVVRNSKIGWTEEKCIEMDKLAHENYTCRPSTEEFERHKKTWSISLNTSGRNAPMKLRSDFREALANMHRLHRESGEERPAPIPFYQYQKWHSSSSSSSTSWWQWNDHWWSS